MKCIECNSIRLYKDGHFKGRQRYKCVECKKSFTHTSKTPKQKKEMVDYYNKHGSYRKTAKLFGINPSTLVSWVDMDKKDLSL